MRLKVLFHFIAAIFISFMLLWMTMLFDIISDQSHLKALLLNLDFLIPSDNKYTIYSRNNMSLTNW